MKRLLLVAMMLSAFGAAGAAHAGCTADNRGGSAGPYDTAGVTFGNLEIKAWTYGNALVGSTALCSDATTTTDAAHGNFEVRRDGAVVCTSNNPAFRMTADPFGFGTSINGTGNDCAVQISFDGISATPGASADDATANSDGGNAGIRKSAPVKNFGEGGSGASSVTIAGETTVIPNGTLGYFTKGVRAQSEH